MREFDCIWSFLPLNIVYTIQLLTLRFLHIHFDIIHRVFESSVGIQYWRFDMCFVQQQQKKIIDRLQYDRLDS